MIMRIINKIIPLFRLTSRESIALKDRKVFLQDPDKIRLCKFDIFHCVQY